MSARTRELLVQVLENRDDASWAVLGDALQADNDPRGTLVTMMLARERSPSQKLFDAEVEYRKQHLDRLLPPSLRRRADGVAWRRGFPVAVTVPSLEALAEMKSETLGFVEVVHAEVSAAEWGAWIEALDGAQLPWRRLRILVEHWPDEEPLELGPWFAALPQLERLDIIFGEYDEGRVEWTDASAPNLRCVMIENALDIGAIEDADLPMLEELGALGNDVELTERLVESELWQQLKTLVMTDPDREQEDDGPRIVQYTRPDEDAYYDDPDADQDAFIAIGHLVDASLIEETARSLSGLRQLSIAVGHVLGNDAFTVVRLYGDGDAELMPYGFAVALEVQLPPNTPIVLVHRSERTGTTRAFALGKHGVRRSEGNGRGAYVLRSMFDIVSGRDPGIDAFFDMFTALACAPINALRGGANAPVLVDIDPGTRGPLPEYDEEFEIGPAEHEIELYEPPVEERVVSVGIESEAVESPPIEDELVEVAFEADEVIADEVIEDDDADDETPDGVGAWRRLLAEWAERAADPDDVFAERVYPRFSWDDILLEASIDWNNTPAEVACESCLKPSPMRYPCAWCGGGHCAACTTRVTDLFSDETTLWCDDCILLLARDANAAPEYKDEFYDDELLPLVEDAPAIVEEIDDEYEEWA